jgi:hypothetical protein
MNILPYDQCQPGQELGMSLILLKSFSEVVTQLKVDWILKIVASWVKGSPIGLVASKLFACILRKRFRFVKLFPTDELPHKKCYPKHN